MTAEVLRRAVQDEVGALLQRPHVHRRGCGRVDEDRRRVGGCGGEVRHRQERIRGCFEPDELHAVRRRLRLIELHVLQAPALELAKQGRGAVVTAFRDRDRVARRQECQHDRGRRARSRREEKRLTPVELSERALGGDSGRVGVALVVELARLAALERPERRAVERRQAHAHDCTSLLRRGRDGRIDPQEARGAAAAPRRDTPRRQREGRRAPARTGEAARARARGEAARPGVVRRARPLRAPPKSVFRDDGSASLR